MLDLFAFTDGACSGNPGPGGWGVLLLAKKDGKIIKQRELKGGEYNTTNNRMELTAAAEALEILEKPSLITLVTDSSYVCDGITSWIFTWKKNNWQKPKNKPIKNEDLWRRLDQAASQHQVKWQWVKGHAGHPENERADALARMGMEPFKP